VELKKLLKEPIERRDSLKIQTLLVPTKLKKNHVTISKLSKNKMIKLFRLSVDSTKLIILVELEKLLKELTRRRDSLRIQTLLVPTKLKKNHVTISKLSKKMMIKLFRLSVDSTKLIILVELEKLLKDLLKKIIITIKTKEDSPRLRILDAQLRLIKDHVTLTDSIAQLKKKLFIVLGLDLVSIFNKDLLNLNLRTLNVKLDQ
jgi:hypothetical protein